MARSLQRGALRTTLGHVGDALIEEVVVGSGGAVSVVFSAIPSAYRHLEIYAEAQAEAATSQRLNMEFNGDTGTNYYWQEVSGAGAVAAATEGEIDGSGLKVGTLPATGEAQMLTLHVRIPFYGRAGRKRSLSHSYSYYDSDNRQAMHGGLWTTGGAITSVTLFAETGDLKEGSIFSLHGVP